MYALWGVLSFTMNERYCRHTYSIPSFWLFFFKAFFFEEIEKLGTVAFVINGSQGLEILAVKSALLNRILYNMIS